MLRRHLRSGEDDSSSNSCDWTVFRRDFSSELTRTRSSTFSALSVIIDLRWRSSSAMFLKDMGEEGDPGERAA